MSKTLLTYVFPGSFSANQFSEQLGGFVSFKAKVSDIGTRTYYDSFDWRLYQAGMALEFNQSIQASTLSLQNLDHLQVLMSADMAHVPRFAEEFTSADFYQQMKALLEMRALLEIATLRFQSTAYNVLNTDEKTILRLYVEEFTPLPTRIVLQIVKGYDKEVMSIIRHLLDHFALEPQKFSLLDQVLVLKGNNPASYSPKLNLKFEPHLRSDNAMKQIYRHLLTTMQVNEQGCVNNVDSEFLHDFRVAVRRSRVGLSQIKKVFFTPVIEEFVQFFSWLGQITSKVRDLDVYLLQFGQYQQVLSKESRRDLEPLRELLQHKQQCAYQELAKHFNSPYYRNTLANWDAFLAEAVPEISHEPCALWPVKQLADERIWKMYRRVKQEALNIDTESTAVAIHDLRKNMKKMRYLMEFFQSLYPKVEMKHALKLLKSWQELLGVFQDYEVQERALIEFREEMRGKGLPQVSILAVGSLIQHVAQQKQIMRHTLALHLQSFSQTKNHRHFKTLFAPKKYYTNLEYND